MGPLYYSKMAIDELKELYFNKLSALNDSSDGEIDSNDVREVLQKSKKRSRSPLPSFVGEFTPERMRPPVSFMRAPALNRTTSAPVSSGFVKETPPLHRTSVVRRSESATPSALDSTGIAELPLTTATSTSTSDSEQRRVSNPTIGSGPLVLPYSNGIQSLLGKNMLGKKRKPTNGDAPGKKRVKKEASIKLVPDNQRIFKDLTFYYVPPPEKSPVRRMRITKAREHGATWTKDFIPSITHIIAEKGLTYKEVMRFLNFDNLPQGVFLVTDDYPTLCLDSHFLLDPTQKPYAICQDKEAPGEETATQNIESQDWNSSLNIKSTSISGKSHGINPAKSPLRRPESSQGSRLREGYEDDPVHFQRLSTGDNKVSVWVESHEASTDPGDINGAPPSAWPGDELEEMIKVARSVEDIPLDKEEDGQEDDRPPSRDDTEESGSEEDVRRRSSKGKPKAKCESAGKASLNQDNFSCMTGGTGLSDESNPNYRTIEVLSKMADYYDRVKDVWRPRAYRRAIGMLRKQNIKICHYDQARLIFGIGHRLAEKIQEIALTNRLRRYENAMLDPSDRALQIFTNIYAVGVNQGLKWVQQGYKSLEDLKAHVPLTENQRIGIEHYDDFLTRIPREEVTALGKIVRDTSASVDHEVEVIIGGSYRRGAPTSGDIDCLLTKSGTSSSNDLMPYLHKLVDRLTDSGFLVAALAVPSETGSKWHGACVLPESPNPIWRRIDFLLVPETELGAALIYFTGDDIFNRSIRLLASKKGWRLNQRGLYKDVLRGHQRVKYTEGSLIEGADENKIFNHLGVPWRPPEQRICN